MHLIGYAWPHRKTIDLLRILEPDVLYAAPFQQLDLPAQTVETMRKVDVTHHPREVCQELDVEYVEIPHDELPGGDVAVIGGARILPGRVVERYGRVINIHPGLLPANRGLDNLLRCFLEDMPAGVTTHLIDARVDAGLILERRPISVYLDDTIVDLGERLYQTGLSMAPRALAATGGEPVGTGGYRPPLSSEEQQRAVEMFPEWKRRYLA